MSDQIAMEQLAATFSRSELDRLAVIVDAVKQESEKQNLIARSTLDDIWSRHILDSAQLLRFTTRSGLWIDIGTGGGFPGLVIAALTMREMLLCEPRRRRAAFLSDVVHALGASGRVVIVQDRVEALECHADTISARAVAPLNKFLEMSAHCSTERTEWLLPRGFSAREELSSLPKARRGMFHVEQSLTDPDSLILIGRGRPI